MTYRCTNWVNLFSPRNIKCNTYLWPCKESRSLVLSYFTQKSPSGRGFWTNCDCTCLLITRMLLLQIRWGDVADVQRKQPETIWGEDTAVSGHHLQNNSHCIAVPIVNNICLHNRFCIYFRRESTPKLLG